MDSPNYAYEIEQEDERDISDRRLAHATTETELRQNFRRSSPQRNSISRNAWMRSSLRRAPMR